MNKHIYFFLLLSISFLDGIDQEENHFSYGECPKNTQLLDKEFYRQAVAELPIVCVDIFLVDQKTNCYLLALRKNRPAQGIFWIPGGRILKGESFFEAAQRKCKEELGITITAKKVLGIYNLFFPDSEWGTATHTPSIVVLATCELDKKAVSLNDSHTSYKWVSIFEPSTIDYIEKVRHEALQNLSSTR